MNDQPTPLGNPYTSPRAVSTVSPPGVLTHQFKQQNVTHLTMASLIIYCLFPTMGLVCWRLLLAKSGVAMTSTIRIAGTDIGPIWMSVIPLVFMLIVLATLVSHWMNQHGYRWLAGQLATRMEEDGLDFRTYGGQFVQLSPADRPSFYDQHSEWDTGYLFLFRERMTYVGDQTRFSIRKELLTGEQVGPGGVQWPHPFQVYIDWRDPITNRIRTFSLWTGVRSSVFFPVGEAEEFRRQFADWRSSKYGASDPAWSELAPPRLDHVERKSQWEQLGGFMLVSAFGVVGFLSFLVGCGVNLYYRENADRALPYAAAAIPIVALLFQHFPLLCSRNISYSVSGKSSEPG